MSKNLTPPETVDAEHAFDVHDRPVLNDPYNPPTRHWQLDPVTKAAINVVREGRRPSGEYELAPQSESRGTAKNPIGLMTTAAQTPLFARIEKIRGCVAQWTETDYDGVGPNTRKLLQHWSSPHRLPRPYFAQLDAIRTIVWLQDIAPRSKDKDMRALLDSLKDNNRQWNDGIHRLATKMATGTGKTLVMQMTIAWLAINHDKSQPLTVLVLTPNTTVKDRLAELEPGKRRQAGQDIVKDAYTELVPQELLPLMRSVRVIRCNFQQFQKRDTRTVIAGQTPSGTAKKVIDQGRNPNDDPFETPEEIARRLVPGTGPVIVINDEAHHCYQATKDKSAAMWFSFLAALDQEKRLRRVYDFSATPAFLQATGDQKPSDLFPWTVSDYPLIEAAEAGLVKVPRNPVADNTDNAEPLFRKLWENAEPKAFDRHGNPPPLVESALDQLRASYLEREKNWNYKSSDNAEGLPDEAPPVWIIVTHDITTATAFYHYIAGTYNPATDTGTVGRYLEFSNCDGHGTPRTHPPTLLVHSQIDQADATGAEVGKAAAAAEIHLRNHRAKTKGAKVDAVREIFQTVGRPGRPGSRIRLVISVSMLTEGWDAKNVTHILGYRAFGSQLLCEQVIGRGLRRTDSIPEGDGLLSHDVVEVYGIPFSFIPVRGPEKPTKPLTLYTVKTLAERDQLAIEMPLVHRYRHQPPIQRLRLEPSKVADYDVHVGTIPTETTIQGVIGKSDHLRTPTATERALIANLAQNVTQRFIATNRNEPLVQTLSLFRAAVTAVEDFLDHPKVNYDPTRSGHLASPKNLETLPQLVLAATNVAVEPASYVPIFNNHGAPRSVSTQHMLPFDTANDKHLPTQKSHVNLAVCDSKPEMLLAQALEHDPLVDAYVRNYRLGFKIPYLVPETGRWSDYMPDFVARVAPSDNNVGGPHCYAIIEYKGAHLLDRPDTRYKAHATRNQWCPAVNAESATAHDAADRHRYGYIFLSDQETLAADLHLALQELRAQDP